MSPLPACSTAVLCPKLPGAEMPSLLHVEVLRQRRKRSRLPPQLLAALQDHFRAIVIFFQLTPNFNQLPRKLAYVADILRVMREDDYGKWAKPKILTKIQIVNSLASHLNS